MSPKIITFGLDGPNRVGKGQQGLRLRDWLAAHGIPAVLVRGDGSRNGLGEWPGDPASAWWQAVNRWLRDEDIPLETWNRTSYRLARELIVWRDRTLPRCVGKSGVDLGVLLVDRTLLSRTIIPRRLGMADVADNLYPANVRDRGRAITAEDVCPDLIFNLTAPPEVLLARLEADDPKYAFRRKLIVETAAWFADAAGYIPAHLRARVVDIDATASKAVTFARILAALRTRVPALRNLFS